MRRILICWILALIALGIVVKLAEKEIAMQIKNGADKRNNIDRQPR